MRHYHIRAVVLGNLLKDTVDAEDLHSALKTFSKRVADGVIKVTEGPGFYQKSRTVITYEEVNDGTTRADSGEIKSRTQVGQVSARVKS